MRHSIHTQHTKSSHRLPFSSVSSGDLLVAVNKILNESHDVSGASACNNVIIPSKYTHSYTLLILFDRFYGVLELFFLYVIIYTRSFRHHPLLIPRTAGYLSTTLIYGRSIPSILYQYCPSCLNHSSSQPSTLQRLLLLCSLWLRHGWRSCHVVDSLFICNAQPSGHLVHLKTIALHAHPATRNNVIFDMSTVGWSLFILSFRFHLPPFGAILFVCTKLDLVHNLHFSS